MTIASVTQTSSSVKTNNVTTHSIDDISVDEIKNIVLSVDKSCNNVSQDDTNTIVLIDTSLSPVNTPQLIGAGTDADPYIVQFEAQDTLNPQNWCTSTKALHLALTACSTFIVSFNSSCFLGTASSIQQHFNVNQEMFTLGISLYVLGFAIGPLLCAPLSEVYGRRAVYNISYGIFIIWSAVCLAALNMTALVIFRFLAGAFGSSTLSNSGAVISDMYNPKQRGTPLALYVNAVLCGPVLGPLSGGYIAESIGSPDTAWQYTMGIMFLLPILLFILSNLLMNETFAPVILQRKAAQLSAECNGEHKYMVRTVPPQPANITTQQRLKIALTRPLVLLATEPIVVALASYMALIYGTLYLTFEAYPAVFMVHRSWSAGQTGLPFLAIGVGMVIGTVINTYYYNPRYAIANQQLLQAGQPVPPELRLPMACGGAILLPISLFIFAWTCTPSIHWAVCTMSMIPWGCGLMLVFVAINSYLIDCYQRTAASALAASQVMRSIFGCVFPLYSTQMYNGLGIEWATTVIAVVSLLCIPIPFVLHKYGKAIRSLSKHTHKVPA